MAKLSYYRAAALKMRLRPNPIMFLHQLMSKRNCIHLDVFASIRKGKPGIVLFTLELRLGGTTLVEKFHWFAELGSYDPPIETDGRAAQYYDPLDYVRFNTRSARQWHEWASQYHHMHMLPIIGKYRSKHFIKKRYKAVHASLLFHYWHVYDLDPFPATFINHYKHTKTGRPHVKVYDDYGKRVLTPPTKGAADDLL